MKQLTCEMCGGTEIIKQDGMYVCQSCGTKYSIEEAKKLMFEIDNSKKLANLYERARKSLEVDDLEHAAEYFKKILDETPNDWEAYFYSYLGEYTTYTNAQAGSVADKLGNTIPAAYDMALANCEDKDETSERIRTITMKVSDRLVGIASTGASLLREYEGGNVLTSAGKVNNDLYHKIRPTAANTISSCVFAYDLIEKKLEEILSGSNSTDKDVCRECLLYLRRSRYTIANMTFEPAHGVTEHIIKSELIREYAEKVKELDPEFVEQSVEPVTNDNGANNSFGKIFGAIVTILIIASIVSRIVSGVSIFSMLF